MKISPVSFCGIPKNYLKIDDHVSRSAQPEKEDFKWLKTQGVTDIFNFRTMYVSGNDFDEKTLVESLGMKYHNIPSVTRKPSEDNIKLFLNEVDEVIINGGKAHIHCKAGADRTGMYSYIYKAVKGLGNNTLNKLEMLKMGHHGKLYPNLIPWTENFINNLLKAK